MADCKNSLFSIGQFAALHEINKKTLMWYDEMGLFKPAVIGENGYRYYTYYQSSTLETILMLRKLNVSIREIREFMGNRSAEGLKVLLEEKLENLDADIRRLKAIRKSLLHKKDEMSMLLDLDLSEITVTETEERYLATVPAAKEGQLEKEIEMVIAEARKQRIPSLHDTIYGSMIEAKCLYAGRFDDYSMLFMDVGMPRDSKKLHRRPAGRYLKAYCKGDWGRLPSRYEEILAFAGAHGFTLCGYAYETGINEIVADSMDGYITQIEIQIEG